MRVGILTFHFYYNYGAVLQNLALQLALRELGHEPVTLDYNPYPERIPPRLNWWQGWGARSGISVATISRRFQSWRAEETRRLFDGFRSSKLCLSDRLPRIDDVDAALAGLDAVVVGSDQVWNGNSHSYRPAYFLDFPSGRKIAGISYAACFGQPEQPPEVLAQIPCMPSRFRSLSVRNVASHELLRAYADCDAPIVADPTLLVALDAYAQPVRVPRGGFVLAYFLDHSIARHATNLISAIRSRLDLPVLSVCSYLGGYAHLPQADHCTRSAGPAQWLYLFSKARCVITDSFHGSLLAVKYRKPLVIAIDGGWRSPRLIDLAQRYALQDHLILANRETNPEQIERSLVAEYSDTEALMGEHSEASWAFLRRALDRC